MKLLVRNLARSITEAEIAAEFAVYGAIQSCSLVMDAKTKTSKGFAFVEMPNQGQAKAAMKSLNKKTIAGSEIRVKKAVDKPDSV